MPRLLRAAALLAAAMILPRRRKVDALNTTIAVDDLTIRRDIAFMPGLRGRMDVYRPHHLQHPAPLVIFLYGGSWKKGHKEDYRFVAAPLARLGLVVAVPDYRLYPEVQFPAFLEDNAKAVAFARLKAAEFGADPQRIYLIGHSAGAYNAVMLGMDPQFLASAGMTRSEIAGVVGIATPADFQPFRDAAIADIFAPAPDPAATQPVSHIDGHNAPLLLLHGGADRKVYPRNATSLHAKVRAAGGSADMRIYRGVGHVGIVTSFAPLLDRTAPVLADIRAFIQRIEAGCGGGL